MKLPPGSYGSHRNWKTCPRQFWHVNLAKDVEIEQTKAITWGNFVHKAFEKRLNESEPFPVGIRRYEDFCRFPEGYTVRAEVKLGIKESGLPCDFFADDVWFRGVLDVVLTHEPDNGTAVIIDHKTGRKREDPLELRMHAVLLYAHRPRKEIKGWYNWLQTHEMGVVHDLSDVAATMDDIRELRRRIEHAALLGRNAFMPKQGPLCPWCPVKHCEYHPR